MTIIGEFCSSVWEKNYQIQNAEQNRHRMTMICFLTAIAYLVSIIINIIDLGFTPSLNLMIVCRSVVFVFGLLAGYTAWNRILNDYFEVTMIIYMTMIGISESIEAPLEFKVNGLIVPVTIIIVLMYYLFVPVSFVMGLVPSIITSVAYTLSIAFFTSANISHVINLSICFIIANVYGIFHLITFNRVRRREFYAIIEQQRLNEELQREIKIRQQAENKLRQLAIMDGLTKVYNRRYFMELLEGEIQRSHYCRNPLSLMMIDIDHFKSVNDTYGHPVGDMALQHLAKILQENIRKLDVIARFGGEEFIGMFPNNKIKEAHEVAQRICQKVAQTPIQIKEQTLNITVSIGVATLNNSDYNDNDSMEKLIKRADTALYQAKEGGRNRVVMFD